MCSFRNPQEVYAEISQPGQQPPPPPPPARPRLTPEQEQMRRLQEEAANKHIREQQERAVSRALQTGQFETGFQPQGLVYQQQPQPQQQPQAVAYQPPQQPQQLAYQPQQQQPAYQPSTLAQYESSFPAEPQYYEQPPVAPQYYQQTRSIRPAQAPQKFSYSQVQLGDPRENLEPRLVAVEQRLQKQASPQPQYYNPPAQSTPQAQYYNPPVQSTPKPQISYNSYTAQPQQQTPTTPQHPQQYLIETTRPEDQPQVVRIPRPRPAPEQSLYYRPEPQEQRQYPQEPPQYPQPLPVADAPSRSAIYVQHSGVSKRITPQEPLYHTLPIYNSVPRVATPRGQRPLTTNEMKALAKAGFNISPLTLNSLQESSEIAPSYEEDEEEYRSSNSKRQSQLLDERKPPGKYPKRIPKPVPLTETERRLLAEQGIRNLYRVESAETKDAPVTYVLAIDNTVLRKRESDTKKQ